MTDEHPAKPFECPDPEISTALNALLSNQQYVRKDVGKIKEHLATLNHRTEKLEIQNIKEATRSEVNREWQTKENARVEKSSKLSQWKWTIILSLMTLISSGTAIAVTALV